MTTRREAERILQEDYPDAIYSLDEESVRGDHGEKAWSFLTHAPCCDGDGKPGCEGHVGYIHEDGEIEGPY